MNHAFPLLLVSALGTLLVARCTSIEPQSPAGARQDVSAGQAVVMSPDGTIQAAIRANGTLTYDVAVA